VDDGVEETWNMLDPLDAAHVATSMVILTNKDEQLQVLMQENHEGPFAGKFTLPNMLVSGELTIEDASTSLKAHFELADLKLEHSSTFSYPWLDPRGRVINIAMVGAAPRSRLNLLMTRNDLALIDVQIVDGEAFLSAGGRSIRVGFCHDGLIANVVESLRQAADYSLLPFAFLEEAFTHCDLRKVHQAILDKEFTPQFLRKKMNNRVFYGDRMIVRTGGRRLGELGKPAELYKIAIVTAAEREYKRKATQNQKKREKLQREGF